MLIVRFAFRCHPGRAEDAIAALIPVVAASRALPGVISIDIARDITDPDAFVATEIYDDRAALDRQMELPETQAALAALRAGIVAESHSLIHHVERSEGFS
jgi:quinol monooxygenase YgiN